MTSSSRRSSGRSRANTFVLVLALALAGAIGALGIAATGAGASVALPPELQALEQNAKALKVSSERFSLTEAETAQFGEEVSVSLTGQELVSPPEGEFVETVSGKHVAVRFVGQNAYLAYPGLSRLDGGRPWVRRSLAAIDKEGGVNPSAVPASPAAGYELLNSAIESVREVGPATVAGQQTVEFTAKINLPSLLARIGASFVQYLEEKGITTADYTIFVAPDGLLVRAAVTVELGDGFDFSTTNTVLETNEPVSVKVPPARRTISYATFLRIERKHAKKK